MYKDKHRLTSILGYFVHMPFACYIGKLPASYSRHLNAADCVFQLADKGFMACSYRLCVTFATANDLGGASYSH